MWWLREKSYMYDERDVMIKVLVLVVVVVFF